jgi:hypothetical protein
MQPMRSRVMECWRLPFFLVGEGWGVSFINSCLVWRMNCPLFTWTVDSRLYMQGLFFFFFFGLGGGVGGCGVVHKVKISHSLLAHML